LKQSATIFVLGAVREELELIETELDEEREESEAAAAAAAAEAAP